MKIYTTYFAMVKKLPSNICAISIASRDPDLSFANSGRTYKKLAPPWYILKKYKENHDEEEYTREYKRIVLGYQNADEVVKKLHNIASWRDVALVCYEKPGNFCHRHIIADWLNENGYHVEEYNFDER